MCDPIALELQMAKEILDDFPDGFDALIPHLKARDMIVEVDHPTIGRLRMAGLPIKLSANPGSVKAPP